MFMKNMQQLELDLALPIPSQRHHRAIERRTDPMFLRDQFEGVGKWGLPFVRRQNIDLEDLNLISCTNCINDEREYYDRGVHFFVDDYNFEDIYLSPEKTFSLYSQYRFCCIPDFSVYPEMRMWRQFESVAHSRWCGAWWQAHGMKVVPTVTWDGYSSFEFCFEGIEGESLLLLLDDKGIAASSGSACTSGSLDPSHVLLAIGRVHDVAHGSLRLTLGEDATEEEVDYIIRSVGEVVGQLRGMSPVWRELCAGERRFIL